MGLWLWGLLAKPLWILALVVTGPIDWTRPHRVGSIIYLFFTDQIGHAPVLVALVLMTLIYPSLVMWWETRVKKRRLPDRIAPPHNRQ